MGISSMQSVIIESLKALEKWQAGPKFFLFGSLFTKRLLLWGSVVSTASVMPPSTAAVKRVFCSFRNNGNKIDNSNEEFTKTLLMLVYTKTQGFGSFHVDWYQKAFVYDINQKFMYTLFWFSHAISMTTLPDILNPQQSTHSTSCVTYK